MNLRIECNRWNSAGGPSGVGSGSGDGIEEVGTGTVDYNFWLTQPGPFFPQPFGLVAFRQERPVFCNQPTWGCVYQVRAAFDVAWVGRPVQMLEAIMTRGPISSAALDLLVGLAACATVFGLVSLFNLENHRFALGVAVIYLAAGLVRTDRESSALILRVILVSLFGCAAALMMVQGLIIFWAPYAVAALLFSAIGILVRRKWSALTVTGRWSASISTAFIVALAGWFVFPAYFDFASTYISGPAIDFDLQSLDGGAISSEDLKGKVILLDFWDTHCGPCRKLMPEMENLHAKYAHDPRVAILVVNAGWEPLEEAQKYVAEHDYSLVFAYDPHATTSRAMGVWELPTTILIDLDFEYHSKHIAYEPGQEAAVVAHYGTLIEKLLAEAEQGHTPSQETSG